MGQDTRTRFIAIVVLTVIAAYVVAPIPRKPSFVADAKINLGIDLAGGAELRYKVLFEPGFSGNRETATKIATDVIRRRVEAKQLKEPKINSRGDDEIIIQLAGVDADGLRDYKRLIETSGKLELHAAAPRDMQERYNKDKVVPQDYSVVDNTERGRGGDYEAYGAQILVMKAPVIEGRHIEDAEARQEMVPGGSRWVTSFTLNAEGAKMFDDAAERLYNQRPPGLIVIMLDGKVKSAPAVQSPSFRGHGQISGAKDQNDAKELSIILRSGSLPAPIGSIEGGPGKPESETFVGPTLGEDAIRRGLLASGITILAVSVFMIIYYRTSGFISVIAMILNLVYLIAVMAFFNATLTLPGIAGVVLTIGMAVDANILIYERIREEQNKGKSASQSFEAGHDRAFMTIIDTHVTTLIAAVVLWNFGTGPVQGFAITLAIGIMTTLFTVLFCGKVFLKMLLSGGVTEWKMMKLLSNPKIDFIKYAKACVMGSIIGTVIVMGIFISRGEKNYGIDFKGGADVAFAMNKALSIDQVRNSIHSIKGPEGREKYADAEIQTVAEPGSKSAAMLTGGSSRTFQMRTSNTAIDDIKKDIQAVFKDSLSHEPFEEEADADIDKNIRKLEGQPEGKGFVMYVKEEKSNPADLKKKIGAIGLVKDICGLDTQGNALFALDELPNPPQGLKKYKFAPTRKVAEDQEKVSKMRDAIKSALDTDLSSTPFLSSGKIGSAVATELRNSTFWAFVVSWAMMIVYVAIRFDSWRYGVAAVVALIHDALFALGFTAVAGAIVPKNWGLNFDMSLNTLAAILTIIGYSINDTIVVFDRIRENLHTDKKSTFSQLINNSVNETLSRTILTSFTVWLSAIVLYVFTATTGGGIADFSFPLIIGVIVGTYSSVYVASPLVLWWYKGQRPKTA
ncbi:MAG TPA: protein translocase subunit SecD [Planctomycetota bacterium]|nr:protein translocase subunit SecD [Planctomycetota bacterium]